ncbi:DNA mismatch repair endonuclease MutL [Virgibacillus soli]|uniref:DNA mismatch repair endonuclease MutL n=1 Tax=Paracerasibacillus soli TaxID=480284 RepID=UPI0035EC8D27
MKIIQMPDSLANKIAAGEVVERPASVVKELVENSIDANCTWVKVDLLEAGLQQIKVTDNGDGISSEDCERAFVRHATSKIKTETDLFHVHTLGFRGEALASIAAVSRLVLKTSQGNEAGTELHLEGGKVVEHKKSDARKGTTITINDLFFNTPARLKYMKTIHTELGHITDVLNRLALAHPEIRFEASHNGKLLFKTSGLNQLQQVIGQVYGMSVAEKMLPIAYDTLDFSFSGFIAKPEVTRASRSFMSIIVNGRYIRNIGLNQAVIRAYHTFLPIGRFPIIVLSIKMDPILVDFNVHPAKLEARFSKEKELVTLVEESIRQKLREATLIPQIEKKQTEQNQSVQRSMTFYPSEPQQRNIPVDKEAGRIDRTAIRERQQLVYPEREEQQIKNEYVQTDVPTEAIVEAEVQMNREDEERTEDNRVPVMYPVGQLHGTYILAQNENGFYMIDQHAAQERIKYEYFSKKVGEPIKESQQLLVPLTFEFSKQEAIFISQNKNELERVGLFLEEFGMNTFVVRSYPNWFPTGYEEEIIREMVEQVVTNEKINILEIRDDAAKMMSCKGSIKANHHLNKNDMFHLLEELRQSTDPFTCPHGRPIIVHFSTYEIEKMFKRVM